MAYRNREADAKAIWGWMSGAAETVVTTAQNVTEAAGDAAVDYGRKILQGVLSGINEVAPSALPTATAALAQLSYSGQVGNFQSAMESIVLSAKFQKIVNDNAAYYGSPYFTRCYINTLSGFLQCSNAVFKSTTATAVEETAVEVMMEKGMFYE